MYNRIGINIGLFVVLLSIMAIVGLPLTGHAATFTVNSAADEADATPGDGNCVSAPTGTCTLRAAIQESNATPVVEDTITLPAGTYTLSIAPVAGDTTAVNGDLDLIGPVIITGAGAATTVIDAAGIDRVFQTEANGTAATVSGVTIRNGNPGANQPGGGVSVGNNTTFTLNNAIVTNCTSTGGAGEGGGLENSGTLNMNTVAITNNTSSGGGGINNGLGGTITLTNGTLSGNNDRAINNSGTITLTNVTISGNSTTGNGAGLDNDGTVTLINVTINGNTSVPGNSGGIQHAAGSFTLRNTIISNNTPLDCLVLNPATLTSQGGNLTTGVGAACVGLTGTNDAVNTPITLGALGNNGGALQTHSLLTTTNPAVDTGVTPCPATDARGIGRPIDGNVDAAVTCDKGAFEFRPQLLLLSPIPAFDFGTVTSGTSSDQIITLSNGGDGTLTFGSIAVTDPLAAPFTKPVDNCTGQSLAPAGSCTMTVRFTPTSAAAATDTFNIPTNDPLTGTKTYTVSGAGTLTLVPNAAVTDSVDPATDNLVAFGSVAVLSTSPVATVTITNNGTGTLVIGTIASVNPLAAPFSIVTDGCSNAALASTQACTLTLAFAPTTNTVSSDTFDIPNNDPDTPTITMTVTGSGVSAAGNRPPAAPVLVSPANNAVISGTTVSFSWNKATDPDGDTVTYHFQNCASADFTGTGCAAVDVAAARILTYAGLGSLGAGIVVFGFMGGFRRSRKTMLLLVALLLTSALFAGACRSKSDGTPPPASTDVTHTVSGLTAGTYYWKVVADDGNGGTASSEVRSYTIQ